MGVSVGVGGCGVGWGWGVRGCICVRVCPWQVAHLFMCSIVCIFA